MAERQPDPLEQVEALLRRREAAAAAGGQTVPPGEHVLTPQERAEQELFANVERHERRREGDTGSLLGHGSRLIKDLLGRK